MIVLLGGYLGSVLGAASVMLTSPICTQYGGMGALSLGAPLIVLMGGFVVLALTVAGAREGILPGVVSFGIFALLFGAFCWASFATWRGTRTGPILTLALGLFSLLVGIIAAITSFAFCASMSV